MDGGIKLTDKIIFIVRASDDTAVSLVVCLETYTDARSHDEARRMRSFRETVEAMPCINAESEVAVACCQSSRAQNRRQIRMHTGYVLKKSIGPWSAAAVSD